MPRFYRECRIKDKQELFLKVYQEEKAECSCVLRVCCIAAGYKENKEAPLWLLVFSCCNHDIGEEEIRKAAEIACIWDYIETLPQGLETVLTERGEGLSEGQVQRIAIARAILNDAPILLLDECTSSLDKDTEWKVLQNLKKMNTKTIICISHTAAGVACCDRVVEIENKKFKEVSNDD